jgi:hypothetical protein
MNKIDLKTLTSIDDDFALWAAEQAALLSSGRLDRVDVENIVGELEYLGNSQKSEIENRLRVLLTHLLKWQFQPAQRSNSWTATLIEQRTEIAEVIRRSPSLKHYPLQALGGRTYEIAMLRASGETGLPEATFPESCPYTIEQILDPDFLPGEQ